MCIKMVVSDISFCLCAGIEFLIKEKNISAHLTDQLCCKYGDTNLGPNSISHCDDNMDVTGVRHSSSPKIASMRCDEQIVKSADQS
jgi:hypothetical protein